MGFLVSSGDGFHLIMVVVVPYFFQEGGEGRLAYTCLSILSCFPQVHTIL